MIKICFVTTVSITIKSFLLKFANYLVDNEDFDVTFICNDDESMKEYCNDKIHYIPVAMKRGMGLDCFKVISKLTKIFKKENFDIIQYSTPNAACYASIAAKKANCKNRLYCQWGIRYMGFDSGVLRKVFKYVERKTCKNSTIIECESFSLRNFAIKEKLYKKEKASVIGHGSACGVDIDKYDLSKREQWRYEIRERLNIPHDAVVFGYAGRFTRDKGINELFEAFKSLNDSDAYLLMIGKFDNENTIDPVLKEWTLHNPKVIFVDWTAQTEKYYSAMDVFVSLSYREGFGLVVIEAAAMGTPCIVTNVPGQVDTITDRIEGYSVNAKNVTDVVDAMRFYLDNKDKIVEFGNAARRNVEEKYEQNYLFKKLAKHRKELVLN